MFLVGTDDSILNKSGEFQAEPCSITEVQCGVFMTGDVNAPFVTGFM